MVLQGHQTQGQVIGELSSTSASKESSYFLLILPRVISWLAELKDIFYIK